MEYAEASSPLPFDRALSSIGVGWFHVRLLFACGLGFSAAAAEAVLMSFIFPEIRSGWGLDEYQIGGLAAFTHIGAFLGQIVFGALADMYGRRICFMLTLCLTITFGLASPFSHNVLCLAALRFFACFGYGGNIAVDFTLFSEFLPTQSRGNLLFVMTLFWPLGQLFTCSIAWLVIPRYGWHVFMGCCTVPSILTGFIRPLIPESPRWLLTQGRNEEATQICRQIAELNGLSAIDVGLSSGCQLCLSNESTQLGLRLEVSKKSADGMFGRSMWQTTLGLLLYLGALHYTSYGAFTLMPSLMEMKGIPKSDMYLSMIMSTFAAVPGILLGCWFATRFGRLQIMRGSMLMIGLALFGFASVSSSWSAMRCTMVASSCISLGYSLFHVYVPEIYPTEIRASASGTLSALGSVIAMGAPATSAVLLQRRQAQDLFTTVVVFASCAMCVAIASCFLLHVETKERDLSDFAPEQLGTAKTS